MINYAKSGALCFILWGLLHVVGGGAVLIALSGSVDAGFAFYSSSENGHSALAGAILGCLAYGFVWVGAVVVYVGARRNWKNSESGLLLNTTLVGFTETGLVFFLLLPGFVGWLEAIAGILLFVAAVVSGGVACRDVHRKTGDGHV
ncbi:hypothetical protein [Pelagibius sp. Alg239-R121]|uniref:hypothetical protein n=1 Tax=Pelagibius sp. Alg239-R121 TaxID=2993448 RepID=UPI0024A7335B|nr:hypothetical protein [Pelagibius sp. Alg239-R121]